MAQRSYFFDSVDHDRIYTAADFARVFGAIAGRDGVIYGYGDELKVTPGSGMVVKVGTGAAFVQGRMLEIDTGALTRTITTADGTNPRIDRVVVRLDLSTAQRRAYLAVKTGTPAATPAAPLLQQDSTIWELSLAQVRVGAGATEIVESDITDERGYTSLATDQLLTHLADLANPHVVTAAQVPYASSVAGFDPTLVSGALDVLAGSRIVDHNFDVVDPPNGYYARWENGLQICSADVLQSYEEGTRFYTIQATYASAFQRVIGSGVSPRISSGAAFQSRLLTFCVDQLTPTFLRAQIQVTVDHASHLAVGISYIVIGTWK